MGVSPHGLSFREQRLVGGDPLVAIAAQWEYRRDVALRQAELYGLAADAARSDDWVRYAEAAKVAEACRP